MISVLTARWVLPITSPPINRGAVAIESGRILAVATLPEVSKQFPQVSIEDLGEAAILPGLINVHSHLELTGFRGRLEEPRFQNWIVELIRLKAERLNTDDLLACARLGCIESLKAGVTTLADTSDADAPLQALIESGQRGVIFQECFGPGVNQAESSLDELKLKLDLHRERLVSAGSEAQARLRLGISPHAPYSVSAKLYELTARFAFDQTIDVAIHAAESVDEKNLLRDGSGAFGDSLRGREIAFNPPGCSAIKYFDQLGVLQSSPLLIHCVNVDEEDIALMAENRARIAHCPKSNSKFGHGIAPLIEFQRAGIRVGLGTDSVASNNTCDLIEEARFCSLIHRAVHKDATVCRADEMLRLLTIEGALVLGMENEIGSLEPGKQADLIAIDLTRTHNTPHYDPATAVIFSCSAGDVVLTMVAGQPLYGGRRALRLDEQDVKSQVERVQSKLVHMRSN
jgi:5-methylthioadenosine/S-adenosylhomocysteine deaminase